MMVTVRALWAIALAGLAAGTPPPPKAVNTVVLLVIDGEAPAARTLCVPFVLSCTRASYRMSMYMSELCRPATPSAQRFTAGPSAAAAALSPRSNACIEPLKPPAMLGCPILRNIPRLSRDIFFLTSPVSFYRTRPRNRGSRL